MGYTWADNYSDFPQQSKYSISGLWKDVHSLIENQCKKDIFYFV